MNVFLLLNLIFTTGNDHLLGLKYYENSRNIFAFVTDGSTSIIISLCAWYNYSDTRWGSSSLLNWWRALRICNSARIQHSRVLCETNERGKWARKQGVRSWWAFERDLFHCTHALSYVFSLFLYILFYFEALGHAINYATVVNAVTLKYISHFILILFWCSVHGWT